jgi:hypothetical protein
MGSYILYNAATVAVFTGRVDFPAKYMWINIFSRNLIKHKTNLATTGVSQIGRARHFTQPLYIASGAASAKFGCERMNLDVTTFVSER